MYTIENETLKVVIRSMGAELDSIYNKEQHLEYLWSGDPAFWPKKSPALFPIVGALKDGTYFFNGKEYHLGRHGFAREMEFTVTSREQAAITFTLVSNEETLRNFPFHFQFDVVYTLQLNRLSVEYSVTNTGNAAMLFSVGAHPAFRVPLAEATTYEDYTLVFSRTENAGRWPISKDSLIETAPVPLLTNSDKLPLRKELFFNDAVVFKDLASETITLQSPKTSHGWSLTFPGFPFMGIWAAKNADFVCIEPWCGIADSVNTDQQLEHKEGIISLAANGVFSRTWTLAVW